MTPFSVKKSRLLSILPSGRRSSLSLHYAVLSSAFYWIFGLTVFSITTQGLAAEKSLSVIAYQVTPFNQTQTLKALGSLQAKQSVNISPNVTENIRAIHFTEGQFVKKGDLLIELDAREELASLEEANALAAEAERQYRRVKDIENKGSVTQSMIDEKFREWQTASAQIKVIEARIADRRILAPFSGQLGFSIFSVGALVSPGNKIVGLDDTSEMRLDMFVPTRYLPDLNLGQPVTLSTSAYPKERFAGKLIAISPRLEQNLRMVQLRALIANPKQLLKTNMMVQASMTLAPKSQLKVPNTALIMLGDHAYVYRLIAQPDDRYIAEKISVTLGDVGEQFTEITAGLKAQDIVVSQGVMRIKPKMTLKIKAFDQGADQETLLQAKPAGASKSKPNQPSQP